METRDRASGDHLRGERTSARLADTEARATPDPLEAPSIAETLRRLEAIARSVMAHHGIPPRADVQPASVAQSVIARALDARPQATSHEHMLAILSAAVEHKIIDRIRRGGRRGRERSEADGAPSLDHAVHSGAAPPVSSDEDEAIARLQAIGSRAIESPETWRLVELHALREVSLGEAAASLGISRDAAKARYHSARERVLAALLTPLCRVLPRDAERITEVVFLERLDPRSAAAALGTTESAVRSALSDTILPALLAAYGRAGTGAITTLARRGRETSR